MRLDTDRKNAKKRDMRWRLKEELIRRGVDRNEATPITSILMKDVITTSPEDAPRSIHLMVASEVGELPDWTLLVSTIGLAAGLWDIQYLGSE